jgi:hypothetical protein
MTGKILLSSLLALALAGCVDNRASFFVQDMKVPTEDCSIPAERDASYYSWGYWDIGLTGEYHVHPLVVNNMTSSTRLNPMAAESSLVQVDGAWVTIMDSSDNELRGETFVPSPCEVDPEGSSTAMDFQAITYDIYSDLAGAGLLLEWSDLCAQAVTSNLVLRIQVVGITAGGQDMETPYFYFPITVCCGCMVYFPSETWDDALVPPTYKCHGSEITTTQSLCWVGQDWDVDCRVCAGNNPSLCDPSRAGFINPWLPNAP